MKHGAYVGLRFIAQVITLNLSYALGGFRRSNRTEGVDWIAGPYEVAHMVFQISNAVPRVRSVVLAPHPFYSEKYWWSPRQSVSALTIVLRSVFLGPWKLGQLARSVRGFIYLSAEGFVNSGFDHRRYEFSFLKRHGLQVVCFFTGSDIRSPRLMRELELKTGRPNLGTYLANTNPVFASAAYDDVKRKIAQTADDFADVIFNAELDQRSYLTRPTHPFLYFFKDGDIAESLSKFNDYSRPVVLHAPSSPIAKGTPLVRAAISELREEGLDFEYVELSEVPHSEVRAALARAHIVLNEFYSYVPGVFGVEAMAAGCAVMLSADETLDSQLPAGSNAAWEVTEHHRIARNLRRLLSDRDYALAKAVAGRDWVWTHAAASVTGAALSRVLAASLENAEWGQPS